MRWRKRGHVYAPDGSLPWAHRYAFPPTPLRLDDQTLRIYVGLCDKSTVARIGYVDVRADDPGRIVRVSRRPVLDIGEPGCFDDNGVVPTRVLPVGDQLYLYYVGFQLGTKVPYFQFVGLAISSDGGETFVRDRRTPVLERSDTEPVNRTAAYVSRDDDGFHIYYSGGDRWTDYDDKRLPVYNLRTLDSPDGKSWGGEGRVCIDFASDDEHVIGRPWLLPGAEPLRMLYSIRTRSDDDYRIGMAVSWDGVAWERRDDEVGIDASDDGWEGGAVAYASAVEHGERIYLFYVGRGRGTTGFGYAELESW